MRLAARLTTGWKDDPRAPYSATQLHETARQSAGEYAAALAAALTSAARDIQIRGLDRLFRRRMGGFEPIKQLVGALASLPSSPAFPRPLLCHTDVFAFAFLKGAKNFDLLLPLDHAANADFRKTQASWVKTITALEHFERSGKALPADADVTAEAYLAIRNIIARPSARDERRALATLLTSGPSTLDEITLDLGLNYTLGQRTLAVFEDIGVVERRAAGVFSIAESALPRVVFCLRETMGLDLLRALPHKEH